MGLGRQLVFCAIAAGGAAALAGPAAASVSCAYNGTTKVMAIAHPDGIDTVTVRTDASTQPATIVVLAGATPVACGAPIVTQVDTITYTQVGGIADLVLQDPEDLAPGFSPEPGRSEIEVAVTETGGILSTVQLVGGDGRQHAYVVGAGGADFDPGDPVPDVDVTVSAFFTDFRLQGGDRADILSAGGGGATGAPYARRIRISGGAGADDMTGGTQGDTLDGGPGDDRLTGGAGSDEVDYSGSTAPVSVDLAGTGPQDGGSLGRDTLSGVEQVTGSPFDDVLRGTDGPDTLSGIEGNDLIEGRGGDDYLDGGDGTDTVSYAGAAAPVAVDLALTSAQDTGGAGKDTLGSRFETLLGGRAGDALRGTASGERIDGGPGRDSVTALGGDDTVLARDGAADTVDCGDGTDSATLDAPGVDAVTGCESTSFPPPAATSGGADSSVKGRLSGARAQRLRRGGIAIGVACPLEACTATARAGVRVRAAGARRARLIAFRAARRKLVAGRSATLRMTLGARDLAVLRAALAAGRRPSVAVTVVVTDAAGNRQTLRRAVRLLP